MATLSSSWLTMIHRYGRRAAARDQVRTMLAWLKENGLVEIDEIASVMVAKLTQRGAETA
jgi:DNA-binding GntR family transcriptional regulator